jgi:DNA-binding MarR family transcriptional regulator
MSEQMKLTAEERTAVNTAMSFLDAFFAINPKMPMSHARAFLLVAMGEGQSVQEYASKLGVAQSVMTRQLLDIGEMSRTREPGYNLVVKRVDPMDLRRHTVWLTVRGRALFHKVVRIMGDVSWFG